MSSVSKHVKSQFHHLFSGILDPNISRYHEHLKTQNNESNLPSSIFIPLFIIQITLCTPWRITYIKKYVLRSVFWDYRQRWKVKKQTSITKTLEKRRKNWIFHNSKDINISHRSFSHRHLTARWKCIPRSSSKIQNCDVFEWCLHLNFIFSTAYLLLHPESRFI